MNIAEEVAEIMLRVGGITLNPKKPFKYSSGILSPIYTDCRVLMGYPKERTQIRDYYIKAIRSKGKFDVIGGTATAGIPHAAWIAQEMKLPMVYVRNKSKDHGKGNQIEGKLSKRQKVAIIEDHISTAESSINCALAIRNAGAVVNYIFSITTYGMKKANEALDSEKINLTTLTNFQVVVDTAQKMGLIKQQQITIVLEWIKDPPSWGKKMGFE